MKIHFLAGALLLAAYAGAQDGGLGRGRGRGGGGGGGGEPSRPSSPPPRTEPPRNDPPRRSDPPPRNDPPSRNEPAPRNEPSREPRRNDPAPTAPTSEPSRQGDPLGRGGSRRNDPPSNPAPSRDPSPSRQPFPSRGGSAPGDLSRGLPGRRGDGGIGRGPIGLPPSRSVPNRYGTVYNGAPGRAPIIVSRVPSRSDFGRIQNRVYRTDRIGIVDGYRIGYVHYNRGWRDDYFNYGFYGFSPFGGYQYVASPFYGYSFLPPYLSYTRIVISNGYRSGWAFSAGFPIVWSSNNWGYNGGYNSGYGYDNSYDNGYNSGYDNGYRDGERAGEREFRAARDAVDDLRYSFLDNDPRAYERLIPRDGTVAILRDGEYDYSLNPQDFEATLRDLVQNSRTEGYRIEDSRARRNEVRVVARHDYTDPWNQRQTMYHHILLSPENGRYVIREFGTSPRRYW